MAMGELTRHGYIHSFHSVVNEPPVWDGRDERTVE